MYEYNLLCSGAWHIWLHWFEPASTIFFSFPYAQVLVTLFFFTPSLMLGMTLHIYFINDSSKFNLYFDLWVHSHTSTFAFNEATNVDLVDRGRSHNRKPAWESNGMMKWRESTAYKVAYASYCADIAHFHCQPCLQVSLLLSSLVINGLIFQLEWLSKSDEYVFWKVQKMWQDVVIVECQSREQGRDDSSVCNPLAT